MPQERKRNCPAHANPESGRLGYDEEDTAPPLAPVPFRFSMRRVRINWRTLHGIDVDRLVRPVTLP